MRHSFIMLISRTTEDNPQVSTVTAKGVKFILRYVAKHSRTNTVRGKQEFIDGLQIVSNDTRFSNWLEAEIRRRYGVNDLDRAIEAAVHELGDVMDFVKNITGAIQASNNPFAGGRVSMGSLFGFKPPTFTNIADLFSKYPKRGGWEE